METSTKAYWAATGLFSLVLGFSGFAHFTHLQMMVESMTALGYPTYFMTIIGFAKLLGVVALLMPGQPLLKEWAYAGFAFNLAGAVATHLFVGDPVMEYAPPAMLLGLLAISHVLRPASRRLAGTSFAALGAPVASDG